MSLEKTNLYPRLSAFLALKGQILKPAFTLQDVAAMFDVTVRTIQSWITSGRLNQRDVPGRAKIFPADLEMLFAASDPAKPVESEPDSLNPAPSSMVRPNNLASKGYPMARR